MQSTGGKYRVSKVHGLPPFSLTQKKLIMAKLKVLVVDDEPGIRSGIARILRNYKVTYPFIDEVFEYEIIEAATGEEALEILQQGNIDLVLLDNKLPGIEGIEVLDYINKAKMDVAVMMITAYASIDLAVKATEQGAYNFLPKPFTPGELKNSIEALTKHLYLKRMTRKMSSAGREVRFKFLSVLSQELKSPLNAVEGYLRIMKERQAGDSLDDYDHVIDRCLERLQGMRTLIMDLLDLTRIEQGEKKRELKPLDLVQIARNCIDTVSPLAVQKNVTIHFDAPDELIYVCSEMEMESIFNNLLSNAVKYNKEGGEVFFVLRDCPGKVEIIVEDTGIGMSKDDLGKLFKEFSRIKNSKTRMISGSGLGLSIVKRIVDLYNGKIDVQSEPDKGSKFVLSLPKS